MPNIEKIGIPKNCLDQILKISIDSRKGIETVFLTDRFLPNKEDIKRYCFDSSLLNKKEALELAQKRKIQMPEDTDKYSFFVHHSGLGIISFQKGDYIITDEGYTTTDGKYVFCYDNQGNELGFF